MDDQTEHGHLVFGDDDFEGVNVVLEKYAGHTAIAWKIVRNNRRNTERVHDWCPYTFRDVFVNKGGNRRRPRE